MIVSATYPKSLTVLDNLWETHFWGLIKKQDLTNIWKNYLSILEMLLSFNQELKDQIYFNVFKVSWLLKIEFVWKI